MNRKRRRDLLAMLRSDRFPGPFTQAKQNTTFKRPYL